MLGFMHMEAGKTTLSAIFQEPPIFLSVLSIFFFYIYSNVSGLWGIGVQICYGEYVEVRTIIWSLFFYHEDSRDSTWLVRFVVNHLSF